MMETYQIQISIHSKSFDKLRTLMLEGSQFSHEFEDSPDIALLAKEYILEFVRELNEIPLNDMLFSRISHDGEYLEAI